MYKFLAVLLIAVSLFIAFDHMMRVDQQNMCERGDQVECPDSLWIFG